MSKSGFYSKPNQNPRCKRKNFYIFNKSQCDSSSSSIDDCLENCQTECVEVPTHNKDPCYDNILYFSDNSGITGGSNRYTGLNDSTTNLSIASFFDIAYLISKPMTVNHIQATVKNPNGNTSTIRFMLVRSVRLDDNTYSIPADTGLFTDVSVSVVSGTGTAIFGFNKNPIITLNTGDLVAVQQMDLNIIVRNLPGLDGYKGSSSIC
jgi:hypothetical protein